MNANVLNQLIEQLAECLTAEAAQKIVAMEAKDGLKCRVNSLASTANAGKLTQDEQSEYPNGCMTWFVSDFDISFLRERIYDMQARNGQFA